MRDQHLKAVNSLLETLTQWASYCGYVEGKLSHGGGLTDSEKKALPNLHQAAHEDAAALQHIDQRLHATLALHAICQAAAGDEAMVKAVPALAEESKQRGAGK